MEKIQIARLRQIDNHSFQIQWHDGSLKDYRLSDLQKICPCVKCHVLTNDEGASKQVDEHVRAVKIRNVGHYGLKIEFSSGCSSGIYHYSTLYHLPNG